MTNEIKLKLTLDGKDALAVLNMTDAELNSLAARLRQVEKESRKPSKEIVDGFTEARNVIQGMQESFQVLQQLFSKPIQAAVEMEQYETAFSVILGNAENARQRMQELTTFAAETPFQLNEVVQASRQLEVLTKGALSTGEGLRLVGDAAAGTGVKINELSMWMGRLYDGIQSGRPVGEALMRLQELGVVSGDTRNQIEELEKTGRLSAEGWALFSESVAKYNGLMAIQAETLGGKLSNLQDSSYQMQASIGGAIGTVLTPLLKHITELLTNLNNVSPVLVGVIGSVTSLGMALTMLNITGLMPSIINLTALRASLGTARVQFHLASMGGMTFAGAIRAAGIAVKGFFASLGPVGWAVVGITLVAEAVNLLSSNTDELKQSMSEEEKQLRTQQKEFERLKEIVLNTNTSTDKRRESIEAMNKIQPGYLQGLENENSNFDKLKSAIDNASGALERNIKLKVISAKIDEAVKKEVEIEFALKNIEAPTALDYMFDGVNKGATQTVIKIDGLIKQLGEAKSESEKWRKELDSLTPTEQTTAIEKKTKTLGDKEKALKADIEKLKAEISGLAESTGADKINKLNSQIAQKEKELKNIFGDQGKTGNAPEIKKLSEIDKQLEALKKKFDELYSSNATIDELAKVQVAIDGLTNQKNIIDLEIKLKSLGKDLSLTPSTGDIKPTERTPGKTNIPSELSTVGSENSYAGMEKNISDLQDSFRNATNDKDRNAAREQLLIAQTKYDGLIATEEHYNAQRQRLSSIGNDAINSGFSSLWNSFAIGNRQAKDEYDAAWLAIKGSALSAIGEILMAEISAALAGTAVHTTAEATKTGVTEANAISRVATTVWEGVSKAAVWLWEGAQFIAKEVAMTAVSVVQGAIRVAVNLAEAASKIVVAVAEMIASLGPIGLIAGVGIIALGVALWGGVKKAFGFEKGGRLKKGEQGYFEGYENEIVAPEKTFVQVFKQELMPQLIGKVSNYELAGVRPAYAQPQINIDLSDLRKDFNKHLTRVEQWQSNLQFKLKSGDLTTAVNSNNAFRKRVGQ